MFPDSFSTERLVLRPAAEDDAPAILDAYARDPEVTRYLTWRPHRDLDDTRAYLAACRALDPRVARVYAITMREGGALCGSLHLRRAAPHRVELGYLLARNRWGRGLMTEAVEAAVRWALAAPGVFRVGAVCDVDNAASARVMEKTGLAREGLRRRWMIHPNLSDEPRDCWSHARVR